MGMKPTCGINEALVQRIRQQRVRQLAQPHLQHAGNIIDVLRPFRLIQVNSIQIYIWGKPGISYQ